MRRAALAHSHKRAARRIDSTAHLLFSAQSERRATALLGAFGRYLRAVGLSPLSESAFAVPRRHGVLAARDPQYGSVVYAGGVEGVRLECDDVLPVHDRAVEG